MGTVRTLLLIAVLLSAAACRERPQSSPMEDDPYLNVPLHVSYDIDVHFYDSVQTRAELLAGRAMIWEDRKETTLGQGITVTFFDRVTGERAAVLTADSAVVDDRSKDMIAIGNVVVVSDSSHTTLRTPRLVWDQRSERIRTDDEVSIISPTERIDGQGMESDQFLTSYRIFKVRGVYQR